MFSYFRKSPVASLMTWPRKFLAQMGIEPWVHYSWGRRLNHKVNEVVYMRNMFYLLSPVCHSHQPYLWQKLLKLDIHCKHLKNKFFHTCQASPILCYFWWPRAQLKVTVSAESETFWVYFLTHLSYTFQELGSMETVQKCNKQQTKNPNQKKKKKAHINKQQFFLIISIATNKIYVKRNFITQPQT